MHIFVKILVLGLSISTFFSFPFLRSLGIKKKLLQTYSNVNNEENIKAENIWTPASLEVNDNAVSSFIEEANEKLDVNQFNKLSSQKSYSKVKLNKNFELKLEYENQKAKLEETRLNNIRLCIDLEAQYADEDNISTFSVNSTQQESNLQKLSYDDERYYNQNIEDMENIEENRQNDISTEPSISSLEFINLGSELEPILDSGTKTYTFPKYEGQLCPKCGLPTTEEELQDFQKCSICRAKDLIEPNIDLSLRYALRKQKEKRNNFEQLVSQNLVDSATTVDLDEIDDDPENMSVEDEDFSSVSSLRRDKEKTLTKHTPKSPPSLLHSQRNVDTITNNKTKPKVWNPSPTSMSSSTTTTATSSASIKRPVTINSSPTKFTPPPPPPPYATTSNTATVSVAQFEDLLNRFKVFKEQVNIRMTNLEEQNDKLESRMDVIIKVLNELRRSDSAARVLPVSEQKTFSRRRNNNNTNSSGSISSNDNNSLPKLRIKIKKGPTDSDAQ